MTSVFHIKKEISNHKTKYKKLLHLSTLRLKWM